MAEGTVFNPPLLEYFYKDDENHDPQVTIDQILAAGLTIGGRSLKRSDIEKIGLMTTCVFEILERAWSKRDCTLVDMKASQWC